VTGWLIRNINLKTRQTAANVSSTHFIEKNVTADGWKVVELGT
jgi:hypothetical protein